MSWFCQHTKLSCFRGPVRILSLCISWLFVSINVLYFVPVRYPIKKLEFLWKKQIYAMLKNSYLWTHPLQRLLVGELFHATHMNILQHHTKIKYPEIGQALILLAGISHVLNPPSNLILVLILVASLSYHRPFWRFTKFLNKLLPYQSNCGYS